MSAVDPRAPRAARLSGPSIRTVAVVGAVVGLLVGAVTEGLVLPVPFALLPLSNSAAPWIVVAFLVALGARSLGGSVAVAVVVLIAATVGFYAAQATRGWAVSGHQLAFWLAVALVAGPVIGLAAGAVRRRADAWGALGAGVLGGVLVGEAIHGLGQPGFLSPHTYWSAQIVVGVAVVIGSVVRRRPERRSDRAASLAVSLAGCASAALVTAAVYQIA